MLGRTNRVAIFGKSNIKLNMMISTYHCLSSKYIFSVIYQYNIYTYYAKLKCLYTSWHFVLYKLVIAVMRMCACIYTCIWVQYVYVFNYMHSYSFTQTYSFINLITKHLCYNMPIQAKQWSCYYGNHIDSNVYEYCSHTTVLALNKLHIKHKLRNVNKYIAKYTIKFLI